MPKYETILNNREQRIQDSLELFLSGFDKIEENLYKRLDEVLKKTTVSFGKLTDDQYSRDLISKLDETIRDTLSQSGYGLKVNQLVDTFDFIAKDNINLQKALNRKVVSEKLVNSVKQIEIQNTLDNLLNAGIYKDFIAPVRQALYRHVVLGTSLHDAEDTIRKIVKSTKNVDSGILRYAKQVSSDSVFQFDGAINQAIQKDLGLDSFLYVGSLVHDSRGQCRFWVKKRILKIDQELKDEISIAIGLNGHGGTLGGFKASGMIPGTNINNFTINRGGYNCRHKAIPFDSKNN